MTPAFALLYKPHMRIRNLNGIRKLHGATYLLVLKSHIQNEYVAHSWHKVARQPPEGYELIAFEDRSTTCVTCGEATVADEFHGPVGGPYRCNACLVAAVKQTGARLSRVRRNDVA